MLTYIKRMGLPLIIETENNFKIPVYDHLVEAFEKYFTKT